ncbi:asparagine synthase-related protein [Sphingobium sp. GW456-12-10-14-TSB1]|uniref:asparagine synthase-related protein n=1 Tax=Sphingobium sp. GW456-12-10-14-TSB1 TaxID=1987165 RepID=UPI0015948BE9|nr:asparagine synthetase B family protein [Sphingobium sp. GW456-12-10-14-TSB1]
MTAPAYVMTFDEAAGNPPPTVEQSPASLTFARSLGGLHIRATREHVIAVGDHGIIIGHLFTRTEPSRRVTELAGHEADAIARSAGAGLISRYWGGYIAVLRTAEGEIRIIRDPSGTIPAYWYRQRDRVVILPELIPRWNDRWRLNADALVIHLWAPHLLGRRTCLAGLNELLPGEALCLKGRDIAVNALWSPWKHVPDRNRIAAVEPALLHTAITDTLRSWGNCFPSVLLGISGGLDSTIVSAGLAGSATALHGLTMVAPGPGGDETTYARQVADAFPMSWVSSAYELEDVDSTAPVVPHVPRPFLAHYVQAIVHARSRIGAEQRIDAYFSGNGGDNVFCLMRSATPLVDRFMARSSLMEMRRTLSDIATLTQAGMSAILRSAVARWLSQGKRKDGSGDARFLNSARLARARAACGSHPWLETPAGKLPGAIAHVRMLARAHGNDGFHSRWTEPPSVAPLLAQPIVERCLAVPSWEWIAGGRDRAAVRDAFSGHIPEALLGRRSKGGPGGFVERIYRRNEATVLSLLRDGILREQGIIEDIGRTLARRQGNAIDPLVPQRLLALAAAECWARQWGAT